MTTIVSRHGEQLQTDSVTIRELIELLSRHKYIVIYHEDELDFVLTVEEKSIFILHAFQPEIGTTEFYCYAFAKSHFLFWIQACDDIDEPAWKGLSNIDSLVEQFEEYPIFQKKVRYRKFKTLQEAAATNKWPMPQGNEFSLQ